MEGRRYRKVVAEINPLLLARGDVIAMISKYHSRVTMFLTVFLL